MPTKMLNYRKIINGHNVEEAKCKDDEMKKMDFVKDKLAHRSRLIIYYTPV